MPKHQLIKQLPAKPMYFGETDRDKPTFNNSPFDITQDQLDGLIKEWLSSITWHKIREEDEEAFRELALGMYYNQPTKYERTSPEIALAEGIEIPNGLVGVKKECDKCNREECLTSSCTGNIKQYPYIIKQKEETQESMAREIVSIFLKWNRGDSETFWIDELKQKFEIKRR